MALFISCWISQSVFDAEAIVENKTCFPLYLEYFRSRRPEIIQVCLPPWDFSIRSNCRPRRKTSSSFFVKPKSSTDVSRCSHRWDSQLQSTFTLCGAEVSTYRRISPFNKPLQMFWPFVLGVLGTIEASTLGTYKPPTDGRPWSMKEEYEPGDLGFDPFGLCPMDPNRFHIFQTKELNNGRVAMGAITLMVAQELMTGTKLFG